MAVVPPAWHFLPLSQAELGPLFSNSSPFSFSQSLFLVPPHSQAPRPGLRASFGPYSVTQVRGYVEGRGHFDLIHWSGCNKLCSVPLFFSPQLISEPVLPLSPTLSASLLSDHVVRERDESGQENFRVRMLFHKPGDINPRKTCVTLHAFKETEEHKASCMTQVRTRFSSFLTELCHSLHFLPVHLVILFPSHLLGYVLWLWHCPVPGLTILKPTSLLRNWTRGTLASTLFVGCRNVNGNGADIIAATLSTVNAKLLYWG